MPNRTAVLQLIAMILTIVSLCSQAKADEALILKYSGGKLIYSGIAGGMQFTTDQGFLAVNSQVFAFRDKCTGQYIRVVDDFIIKLSKEPINCSDLPRPQD